MWLGAARGITQNTRGAYPIEFIRNAKIPCVAGHPTDVIFLTCDAFGVLPPIARLTPEQAMFHFLSGYTAKLAGTEVGVTEPQTTFSTCFGSPFLPLAPGRYASMLGDKIARHGSRVWLVNTGWTGGRYGIGKRMPALVARHIFGLMEGETDVLPSSAPLAGDIDPVTIYGSEGVSVQLAPCCLPIPGDQMPSGAPVRFHGRSMRIGVPASARRISSRLSSMNQSTASS